jgi:hypothetical protein
MVLLVSVVAAVLFSQRPVNDGVWRINFAPESAPAIPDFLTVDAGQDYNRWRGYGWLDATGSVATGRWPGDGEDTWESRDNLNVILRPGPDDLARGFASGPVIFALDLEPGTYEVWALSGDAGRLEYSPRDDYRILVEGEPVYSFETSTEKYLARFETPPKTDQRTYADIWDQSVAPRFRWSRVVVEVSDGQLSVRIDGRHRDNRFADLTGDYARTEARNGPAQRYSGALNALLVTPFTPGDDQGTQAIASIEAWRRANLREKWPQTEPQTVDDSGLSEHDFTRGYTAYPVNPLTRVLPYTVRQHAMEPLRLRATPGEFVPLTFAVTPLAGLGETRVEFELHPSTDTSTPVSMADDLAYGVVRYAPVSTEKRGEHWQGSPAMIVPTDRWNIHQGVTRQFWLTYRVPGDLLPGHYTGTITVHPANGQTSRLAVELEVLPFPLQRPTDLAIGMTYFSPAQYAQNDEATFWSRVQAEFADMRAHNMTTVQFTGIHMDDHERMERALGLYREAGFEQPVYLLESYGAMARLQREGLAWRSRAFYEAYVAFIQAFLRQADERGWPPIIINFGDEFTNRGLEEFGAEVARRLKQIPAIVTAADVNGYWEMKLLAPEVDIVAFNDGWDGPRRVNAGRRLLNAGTVATIKRAGATPWLVNIGMDRFSNGFWLWKMVQLGVRGKIEWIYRGYNGMPYDSFDAEPLRTHAVYPGPEGAAIPSLDYERMRIGLDDLAYLHTLEQWLERSRGIPDSAADVAAAEAFLARLNDMINADIKYYRRARAGKSRHWTHEQYDTLRDEIIDLILALQNTTARQ